MALWPLVNLGFQGSGLLLVNPLVCRIYGSEIEQFSVSYTETDVLWLPKIIGQNKQTTGGTVDSFLGL